MEEERRWWLGMVAREGTGWVQQRRGWNVVRFGALQVRYEDWMRQMGLGFVAVKRPATMEVLGSG
ncbi:hypothetical protein Pyn_02661 [Prunus yedoensis var. nudiflora]|uniref:Uncharacterized protein n=1 Tax=Prunus yedoensis var. nudiflora TaxID=2094558 RepID=A0A314ZJG0_PRUYE|nr:hypothetical protein Pyn_02661 [Prunus yedoensis var. nudiflora]